ncbi:MAG: hypothetical protein HY325_04875 [Chloroflexi bacterium]|nr:hypothetical protein [Chloroflexota bacterium]
MFEWLTRPLGKSKQKATKLPTKEATAPLIVNKAAEQGSFDSFHSLLKTAIADAEEIAASVKMKAQTEAEAEAARIIAQANQESQEIKRRAEIAAQREAENILAEANRKGQILEVETRQKALQFLMKAGEEVGKEINKEYQRAYSRLSSSLEELMNEGREIEMELEGKAARLLESTSLELKGLETVLLSTAEAILSPGEAAAAPARLEEEAVAEAAAAPARLEEEAVAEAAAAPARLEEEAVAEAAAPPARLEEEAVVEAAAPPAQLEEEALEKHEAAPVALDVEALYTGEIELIIVSPVELKLVSRLYNYLQTVPELRILYTRGSWDQGTTIIVVLDNPLPLLQVLAKTPDVQVIPELLEKEGVAAGKSSSLLRGGQGAKKMNLILKEA